MKVILLEELKGKGGEGDVIEVATGYAVNYLLPKKIAVTATSGNLKQLELRKHNIAKREADRLDTADKLLAALEGQNLRIAAKVGDEGQLFGSITPIQIAEAIAEKFSTEVDRRKIDVHGMIKTAGTHEVTISIYRDIKANMTVEVVDENEMNAAVVTEDAEAAEAEAVVEGVEAVEAAVTAEGVAVVEGTVADGEIAAESVVEAVDGAVAAESEVEVAAEAVAEAEASTVVESAVAEAPQEVEAAAEAATEEVAAETEAEEKAE